MRKKKVVGLMLSFTLAFGLALPASMAMPIESTVIASDSNATEEEERIIEADSDAREEEKSVITSEIEKEENVVVATDSNAAKTENSVLATDSNATKVTSEHIETCLEGCTGEDCECMCHMPSLFERLMATETMEEFEMVVAGATEEELNALSNKEIAEIEDHVIEIEPKPLPAIVLNNTMEETVQSEIVYLTLSYTDVAPFGAPVVGKKE